MGRGRHREGCTYILQDIPLPRGGEGVKSADGIWAKNVKRITRKKGKFEKREGRGKIMRTVQLTG
jgi:hypothetical protein